MNGESSADVYTVSCVYMSSRAISCKMEKVALTYIQYPVYTCHYVRSRVKWRASGELLCNIGSSVMTERAGLRGGDICIIMTDLYCCTAETNTPW